MKLRALLLGSILATLAPLAAALPASAEPDVPDGNVAPYVLPFAGGTATFTGGQLLHRGFTFIPEHQGGAYTTTSKLGGGYTNPLTVTFSQPVTNVNVLVLNNGEVGARYTVGDIVGITTNTQGTKSFGFFPGPLTSLTVAQTDAAGVLVPEWDFAITLIGTDEGDVIPAATALPAPDGFTFTEIVDTLTPVPGGSDAFQTPNSFAFSGETVAFLGNSPTSQGIYTGSGAAITTLANRSTPIPDGTGTFATFSAPAISGTTVAFPATGSDSQAGIYASSNGSLTTVADKNTAIPNGTGNFTSFSGSAVSGTTVAFRGAGTAQSGVYTASGGSLTKVADLGDAVPGGTGNFTNFGSYAVSGSTVAFLGFRVATPDVDRGIYVGSGGPLTRIADLNTAIPGGTGNFTSFNANGISISDGTVAFGASGTDGQSGIYVGAGGALTRIADTSTPIPGGAFTFTSFGPPSISGSSVAFFAEGIWGQGGVYLFEDGVLRKVIGANPIGARTVATLSFPGFGLEGTSLAFFAFYANNDRGLVRADWAPAPACGDGTVDAGEQCDDGNTDPGDGCSATCEDEDPCTILCASPQAKHVAPNNGALIGTGGDDILCGDERNNVIRGGSGDDTLCGFGGTDSLYGQNGNDHLDGGTSKDVLRGDDGDDTLLGGDGDDSLLGGDGDDTVLGGIGNDAASGDAGNDTIRGGPDSDSLLGHRGDDDLAGDAGNDTLRGGAGNDALDGGDDTDKLRGEGGSDSCIDGEVLSQCESNS